ncbi:MAG: hypothetical protein WC942_04310 [Clostridia bacterium]|jgi:hypothetical protein
MKINEFIQNELKLLEKFQKYWTPNSVINQSDFPEEMELGEWVEQFTIFVEIINDTI